MQAVEGKAKGEILVCSIDGSMSSRNRNACIEEFKVAIQSGRKACLFSTASLIGEGFDLPELDTLFLAMPVSFRGRIVQYAGRLHRESPKKSEVLIFDYLDYKLQLANSMYRKRSAGYREMGYDIRDSNDNVLL
jgi:superfamily II DNA or RNA helicase